MKITMKKILFLITILMPMAAWAQLFKADITVNGSKKPAEFMVSGKDECKLGNGRNTCVPQYVEGFVSIPNEVTYKGTTYKVKEINKFAFRLCSKITSVNISEGVTRVGEFAFQGCCSLEEIDLCTTLKTIGSGAFIDLPKLKKVKCDATTPPTWEYNDVFKFHSDGIGSTKSEKYNVTLHVPDAAINTYKESKFTKTEIGWNTAEGWANFSAIGNSQGATLRITNAKELVAFRDATNNGLVYRKVVLENDIDMSQESAWTEPICANKENPFTGVFDGQGHTISGLHIHKASYEPVGTAALFGYAKNARIVDLRMKKCTYIGKTAGTICSETIEDLSGITYTSIDSVFVEECTVQGTTHGGGLVGKASMVNVDRSVVLNTQVLVDNSYSDTYLSGMLGWVSNGTANNVAVIGGELTGREKKGTFIGSCKNYKVFNSFTTYDLVEDKYESLTQDNCVYKGKDFTYKNESGETKTIKLGSTEHETMFCVAILGLADWVYYPNKYPLPACFEDRLPEPTANVMTLRPRGMADDRVNGLSLAEGDEKTINWTDFSSGEGSFLSKTKFKASRLWVDGNLAGSVLKGELPIGKTTITARDGIRYDRTLEAKKAEPTITQVPVFEVDSKGRLVIDDDGQPVITGYEEIEEDDYDNGVYPLYLPFHKTMPINCLVFKPIKLVSDADGIAKIEMEKVESREVEAWTPYFVVVSNESVSLGTTFETITKPSANSISLGDNYEFTGTLYAITKDDAVSQKIYCMDAEDNTKWSVMNDKNKQDIPAFSAFFRSKGSQTSAIELTMEHISDANFEYEMFFDDEDNRILYVSNYKGEGGDIVIPSTVTAKVGGTERTMNVVGIEDDVFQKKGAQIRSIDLSKCENIENMYVDRNMNGNPFHGLKETALIFMPKNNGSLGVNVVNGDQCQKLLLKEGEDFYSPRDFKAKNVEYKRVMAANDNYTICLPYSAPTISGVKYYELKGIKGSSLQFSEVTQTKPGVPYMVVTTSSVDNFDYDENKNNGASTDIVSKVAEGSAGGGYTMYGTYSLISPAETIDKFILQDQGKWQRAKTENPNVYISPFRAYLLSTGDSDDTGSEVDDGTGINNIHTTDLDGTERWYDLNGRIINGAPSKKGVYIRQGKKIVIR